MSFGLERIGWLHLQVLGNPLWQYLAALIYIVLAFYVSKLLDLRHPGAVAQMGRERQTKL